MDILQEENLDCNILVRAYLTCVYMYIAVASCIVHSNSISGMKGVLTIGHGTQGRSSDVIATLSGRKSLFGRKNRKGIPKRDQS